MAGIFLPRWPYGGARLIDAFHEDEPWISLDFHPPDEHAALIAKQFVALSVDEARRMYADLGHVLAEHDATIAAAEPVGEAGDD